MKNTLPAKPKTLLEKIEIAQKNLGLEVSTKTASNYRRVTLEKIYKRAIGLKNHFGLKSIDLNEYADIDALVMHVAMQGTNIQRVSLIEVIGDDCGIGGVTLIEYTKGDEKKIKSVISFIDDQIQTLANDFGVMYSGESRLLAQTIYTKYSGLTFLDVMIFFNNCRFLKYKTETQHISTRGINMEFILMWLGAYLDERETYLSEAMAEVKIKEEYGVNIDINTLQERARASKGVKDFAIVKQRRLMLEEAAHQLRESTKKEVNVFIDGGKEGDGVMVKIRRHSEFIKMFDNIKCHLLSIYDPKGDNEAESKIIMKKYFKFWLKRTDDIDLIYPSKGKQKRDAKREYMTMKARAFNLAISKVIEKGTSQILMLTNLMSKEKGKPFGLSLVGGDINNEEHRKHEFILLGKWHTHWLTHNKEEYYSYLKRCIDQNEIPLEKHEYLTIEIRRLLMMHIPKEWDILYRFMSPETLYE